VAPYILKFIGQKLGRVDKLSCVGEISMRASLWWA